MSEYKLELKQIVEYPRSRIYRQFVKNLISDRNIRTNGGSDLFYFTVLCSYANFSTSYKRIGEINYTISPGEGICRTDDIAKYFRACFHWQAISILNKLQEKQLITYKRLGGGRVIKFEIKEWNFFNPTLDYNAPCQKDTGFFFLPISKASEIISTECCSEMDIVLDIWMNTVYNDEQVEGSKAGPIVYMRNGTGSSFIEYSDLAVRWNLSKSAVRKVLKKLENQNYLSLFTFSERHGSVICLQNYLLTMFRVSDVMIDKEEIAMDLNINVSIPENESVECSITEQIEILPCSSNENFIVSKPHIKIIIQKLSEILAAQGIPCCNCFKSKYSLSPVFSGCKENISPTVDKQGTGSFPQFPQEEEQLILEIFCEGSKKTFLFELALLHQ